MEVLLEPFLVLSMAKTDLITQEFVIQLLHCIKTLVYIYIYIYIYTSLYVAHLLKMKTLFIFIYLGCHQSVCFHFPSKTISGRWERWVPVARALRYIMIVSEEGLWLIL